MSQVFYSPPQAGKSDTALARRSLDGLRRRLARIRGLAWLAATGAVVATLAAAGAARSGDEDTHGRDAVPDYARVFNQ